MSKKVKIFAIVTIAIALLIGGFSFFGGSSEPAPPPVVGTPLSAGSPLSTSMSPMGTPVMPGQVQGGSNEFASLLTNISNITIDTTIFTNPLYLSLRDYPVLLGSDVVGRSNPFAGIGTDVGEPVAENANIEVLTLQPGKITGTTAEFGAQITIHNTFPATVSFEYGPNDTFTSATNPQTIAKSGLILITVSDLIPQTQYSVRAVAVRGSTTRGNTVPFTTLPAPKPKQ